MRRARRPLMAEMNLTNLIDVTFALLIIFMITAPLLSQGVNVDLPQVPSNPLPEQSKDPVIISVDNVGNFYISFGENQDDPVSPDDLVNRVGALIKYRPGIPVYVKGDQRVAYGRVVELMAILQGAGVPSVGLITEPPEQ